MAIQMIKGKKPDIIGKGNKTPRFFKFERKRLTRDVTELHINIDEMNTVLFVQATLLKIESTHLNS